MFLTVGVNQTGGKYDKAVSIFVDHINQSLFPFKEKDLILISGNFKDGLVLSKASNHLGGQTFKLNRMADSTTLGLRVPITFAGVQVNNLTTRKTISAQQGEDKLVLSPVDLSKLDSRLPVNRQKKSKITAGPGKSDEWTTEELKASMGALNQAVKSQGLKLSLNDQGFLSGQIEL